MKISSSEARERGFDPDEIVRIERAEAGQREADQLRDLIDKTFVNIPPPRTTLRVARALDDEWEISERRAAELANQDPETDWREVSEEKTKVYQEYFNFSNAAGWRFYLPAFMTHYLSDFPDYSWDAVYWACVRREKFDELREEEIAVVEKFVALCQKYEAG